VAGPLELLEEAAKASRSALPAATQHLSQDVAHPAGTAAPATAEHLAEDVI
jgi:hypothetical protein